MEVEFLSPRKFQPSEQTVHKLVASRAAIDERDFLLHKHGIEKWVCVFPRKRKLNPQKNWPEQNWQRLMDTVVTELKCGVVLMGREEDTALIGRKDKWFISTAAMPPERRMALFTLPGPQL